MALLGELRAYARFARGLPAYVRDPVSLEQSVSWLKDGLAHRDESFLAMVERNIFGNPRSPYLSLLRWAGCELGDLKQMVQDRGLEATLEALLQSGVYVGFEEFKGREPIVRGSNTLEVKPSDFDSPFLLAHYQASTSGSTGRATRVSVDLESLTESAKLALLSINAHGVYDAPGVLWSEILPSPSGISTLLICAKISQMPERWFTPVSRRDLRRSTKSLLATKYILATARRAGVPMPGPEPLEPARAETIARWAEEKIRLSGRCVVATRIGFAMRISVAARQNDIDLSGLVCWGGGEPVTPAKMREVEASGARYIPTYATAEIRGIGMGCAAPLGANDNHLLKHQVAVIRNPRQVPGFDVTVDAFLFTRLASVGSKVILNVESDDYGVIEKRDCGCRFAEMGLDEHVSDIFSFSKLTGAGVTLVGSDLVRILEEDLPERFGGGPQDYQLIEEEDDHGYTRASIVVSPRIQLEDERLVIEEFLDALKRSDRDMESALFRSAELVRVRRMEPLETGRGKFMPLHAKKIERPS